MEKSTLEKTWLKDQILTGIFAILLPVIILGFLFAFIVSCFKLGYDVAQNIIDT